MEKWRILKEETVFEAPPYLSVKRQSVETGSGQVLDDFYQVHLRPFVVCVPFLENGNALVIRQYKHGPGRVSLTFPAGFVDAGEAPIEACRRELFEETALKTPSLRHLGEFTDNGNQRGCVGNFYVATGCQQTGSPISGDHEQMTMMELSPAQLDAAVLNRDIVITHHALAWSLARLAGS